MATLILGYENIIIDLRWPAIYARYQEISDEDI
jgi:hypothetical protein